MCIVTASLWLSWWWVVISVDPFASDWLGLLLFYITLFLALIGTFTVLGVFLRRLRMHEELLFHLVMLSSRQSIVLSALVVIFVFLQSHRVLSIWSALFLVIIVIGLEFFILFRQQKRTGLMPSKPAGKRLGAIGMSPVFDRREVGGGEISFEKKEL